MLTTLYYHIRNNHPIVYFSTVITSITIILAELVSFTANNTALFDILGAESLKTRIIAAKETAYWNFRAWQHNDVAGALVPEHGYGFLQSVNHDGTVNITIIKDKKYQSARITLADTKITNPNALAAIVEMHKSDNADFDLYQTGQQYPYTVVWLNNEPFNIQLITAGTAKPDTTPPTNIVDRIFAEYFWKQLTN